MAIKYVVPFDPEGEAPYEMVEVRLEGMKPAWVDADLAERLLKLLDMGKVMEARTVMIWFGGEEA